MNTQISATNIFIKIYNMFIELSWLFFDNRKLSNPSKLEAGDQIDICQLIRRIFLFGPIMIACYIGVYALVIYTLFGTIAEYGFGTVALGWTWYIGIVAVFVGIFYGYQFIKYRISKAIDKPKSTEPSVFKTWYVATKTKTCILFKVG